MDTTSKLLIGAGAVLALLLGFVVYTALAASPTFPPTATVVIARTEIPPYTLFTAANVDQWLTTRQALAEAVPSGAMTQPAQAVAHVTTIRLMPGEIVLNTPDRLTSGAGEDARPSAVIPEGKVALTIPANDTLTVAGALRAGDRIDVLVTWTPPNEPAITRALYQGVTVFAVGPWQSQSSRGENILSLNVPPRRPATAGACPWP